MTNRECIKQVKKLIGNYKHGGLHVLIDQCKHLIKSGGIDISEDEQDSFYSAKIVLHVSMLELAEQLRPISQQGNEVADNLKNF